MEENIVSNSNSSKDEFQDADSETRIRALEIRLQHLLDAEKERLRAMESREWHIKYKPQFDWRQIIVILAANMGMLGFFWYWIFQHKGLH